MPRHNHAGNAKPGTVPHWHTRRQKGTANRRRDGRGAYSRGGKAKHADRYDRPYLDGTYDKEAI